MLSKFVLTTLVYFIFIVTKLNAINCQQTFTFLNNSVFVRIINNGLYNLTNFILLFSYK